MQQSSHLLALPREIRDEIYAYVQSEDENDLSLFDHDHLLVGYTDDPVFAVQLTKAWKETKITVKTNNAFVKSRTGLPHRQWLCEQTTMLAILNTCRQLHQEPLSLWLKHVGIVTDLSHLGGVIHWLVDMPQERYDQLSRVDIRLLDGPCDDPWNTDLFEISETVTQWTCLEEIMMERGVQLTAVFQLNPTISMWGKAYRIAKSCRSAGMSFHDIDEVMFDMSDIGELVQERWR